MKPRLLVCALALLLTGMAAPAGAECVMTKVAEAPVTMSDLRPTVTVKVNGHDAVFFIDSGAFFSTISPEGAARFGLVKGPLPPGMTIRGVGGGADMSVATAKSFDFAGIPYKDLDFLVSEQGFGVGAGPVGTIGQNLLGKADVEYDLANGMMRMFVPERCDDTFLAYWVKPSQAYSVVHITPAQNTKSNATATASVNGAKIWVLFDTGSAASILSTEAATSAGIKPPDAGKGSAGYSSGVGLHSYLRDWIAPVDSFKLGDEEIQRTRLRFGDLKLLNGVDMLIGADFFLSHRVLVSNSQHKLYFTYVGGPVFNLTTTPPPPADAVAPGPAETAAATPDAYSDAPTDAAGFSRRAAAYRARRDFTHAAADLNRAIELDPKEPRYLYERGVTELATGRSDAALADFDHALKLKPDDFDVLLERARFDIGRKDKSAAKRDLDDIDRLAADDADVRLALGAYYDGQGLREQAIAQADRWIATHPKSDQLAEGLNERCWVRTRANKGLDLALADCNAALKLRPGNPQYLDSRGLVYLRMGETDKALTDYEATLRLSPNSAWSLYGRGLAELKKGHKSEGEADIAAALVVRPDLADEAKDVGLAP